MRSASSEGSANGTNAVPLPASGSAGIPIVTARAAMAHVGDSRAYLLRDGRLNQLTKDDTYVQMLVDQGLISPDEAAGHLDEALVVLRRRSA